MAYSFRIWGCLILKPLTLNSFKGLCCMEKEFCSLSIGELEEFLKSLGEEKFRAGQIMDWVYAKGISEWGKTTNLSGTLKKKLQDSFVFPSLTLVRCVESRDGETLKFLWKLNDGAFIESVLIYSNRRRTVCVSSQLGCAAKCSFCASGKKGFFRNLSAAEIVEQARMANVFLRDKGEEISHIVFMGMGEPMQNLDAVIKAIELFHAPYAMNISQRRITVSTVGIVEGINRLSEEKLKVNLVLSLHAPNQYIRKKIIPYAKKYPLEQLLLTMDRYFEKTKRDITYEYILIDGVNDQVEHAMELSKLMKGRQSTVNLIPYNPTPGLRFKKPPRESVERFRKILSDSNIINTCRYTKGDDIAAACGQLALWQNENKM